MFGNPQLLQRLECFRHGNQNNTSFVDLGMTLASCKLSLSLAHVRFVFAVAVCNQQFGCLLFQHVFFWDSQRKPLPYMTSQKRMLIVANAARGRLYLRQFRLATSFASKTNKWPILAASWSPLDDWKLNFVTKPRRRRGRPSCRWDDRLSNFAECRLKSSWPEAAKRRQQWVAQEQSVLNFCRSQ